MNALCRWQTVCLRIGTRFSSIAAGRPRNTNRRSTSCRIASCFALLAFCLIAADGDVAGVPVKDADVTVSATEADAVAVAGGDATPTEGRDTAATDSGDAAATGKDATVTATPQAAPSEKPKEQGEAVDELGQRVDEAIRISSRRYLTAGVHTPWQLFHGLLALKQEYIIIQNDRKILMTDWLKNGASYGDEWLFQVTDYGGQAHPFSEPYIFQGHPQQFLAMMATAKLPMDFQLKADRGTITIADLVRNAQMDVDGTEETTWTLWALSTYLEPDAKWTNKWGTAWSIESLVRSQLDTVITGAACGGTHVLFALTNARDRYLETGRPLQGVWLEADQTIKQHIRLVQSYQNQDGSLSTNHFAGPGYSDDFMTRLETTGHTLEWLTYAISDDELKQEWYRRAVAVIATELIDHRADPIDCGPLYHSVSGLMIYRSRTRPNASSLMPSFPAKPATTATQQSSRTMRSTRAPVARRTFFSLFHRR